MEELCQQKKSVLSKEKGRDGGARQDLNIYKEYGKRAYQKWYAEKRLDVPYWLFRAAKKRAKSAGIQFSIKKEDVVIPEMCPILGIKLEVSPDGVRGFWNSSPSLDRIDNDRGYEKDNIAVISWRANRLKGDATLAELESLVLYMRERTVIVS